VLQVPSAKEPAESLDTLVSFSPNPASPVGFTFFEEMLSVPAYWRYSKRESPGEERSSLLSSLVKR
jgi:hypothetical protein